MFMLEMLLCYIPRTVSVCLHVMCFQSYTSTFPFNTYSLQMQIHDKDNNTVERILRLNI